MSDVPIVGIMAAGFGLVGLAIVLLRIPPSEPPGRWGRVMGGLLAGAAGVIVLTLLSPILGLFLAGAGLIWSTAALWPHAARRQALARLIVCLGLVAAQITVLIPVRMNIYRLHVASICAMRLSCVGKAIAVYQAEHGQWPRDLETLANSGGLSPRELECPPFDASTDDTTYFYCAPLANGPPDDQGDSQPQNGEPFILACDIAPFHPAGLFDIFGPERCRHVVLSDFGLKRFTESEFQRELQKPQNRRFAIDLAHGVGMRSYERVKYTTLDPRDAPRIAPQDEK